MALPSAKFVLILSHCAAMGLLTQASVAIDGSKFKAGAKMERRMAQIEESVARYLEQLDTADRQEPSEALQTKTNRLKEKIATLKQADAASRASQGGDACHPGPADIADRSRCPLDGHQRPRFRRRRLQRSDAVEANDHLIVMHEVLDQRLKVVSEDPATRNPLCQRRC
jgi:hypothetical protein